MNAKSKPKPLRNEKRPIQPIFPWLQPPDTFRYKVKTGDTWLTLGARNHHQFGDAQLIFLNFGLNGTEPFFTEQVNWYLREYVGCCHSLDGGRNWAFTDDADPGFIYLPHITLNFDGEGEVITGFTGVGGDVTAPGYDDSNAYDAISKSLDIYGMAELGLGVSEVALPLLLEGGLIVTGAAAAVVAPAVAVGAGHADALRILSRGHFFEGFSIGLVMSAHGWSKNYILERHELKTAPGNSVYPEKRETFRKLHNVGLAMGIMQGKRFNTVDFKNLFTFLRSRLTEAERQEYRDRPKTWSEQKRRKYYGRLSSIVKKKMLDNNLQLKIR